MIDMSPEAISKRKEELKIRRELAESVWNNMDNEGNEHEKEYWIKGYCDRMVSEEISDEEIEKASEEFKDGWTYKPLLFIEGAKWYKEQLKRITL
jgi:hypothetical protein